MFDVFKTLKELPGQSNIGEIISQIHENSKKMSKRINIIA